MSYFQASVLDVPLAAATPLSVLGFVAAWPGDPVSVAPYMLVNLDVSFDGVDATAVPVLIEVYQYAVAPADMSTLWQISQPGDLSQSVTMAGVFLNDFTWTEPALRSPGLATSSQIWRVSPAGGVLSVGWEPGVGPGTRENNSAVIVRLTAVAPVNATVSIIVSD